MAKPSGSPRHIGSAGLLKLLWLEAPVDDEGFCFSIYSVRLVVADALVIAVPPIGTAGRYSTAIKPSTTPAVIAVRNVRPAVPAVIAVTAILTVMAVAFVPVVIAVIVAFVGVALSIVAVFADTVTIVSQGTTFVGVVANTAIAAISLP
jgi:hypothetical protein